jgi:hypothetical protein
MPSFPLSYVLLQARKKFQAFTAEKNWKKDELRAASHKYSNWPLGVETGV